MDRQSADQYASASFLLLDQLLRCLSANGAISRPNMQLLFDNALGVGALAERKGAVEAGTVALIRGLADNLGFAKPPG